MRITILGSDGVLGIPVWNCSCPACSSKDPKDKRTRSSILVQSGGKNVLVDMGPDFREQALKHGIRELDTVLLTHVHIDHTASTAELRAARSGMTLEAPKPVFDKIEKTRPIIFSYLRLRSPNVKVRVFEPRKIGNMKVDSIRVQHEKDFNFGEEEPTYGFLFEESGFRMAYIPDFSRILEPEKVKNLDLLICDGTYPKTGYGHAGIEGGLKLYKEIKPKKLLFTHISHSNPPHAELERNVSKHGNVRVAFDGMVIES